MDNCHISRFRNIVKDTTYHTYFYCHVCHVATSFTLSRFISIIFSLLLINALGSLPAHAYPTWSSNSSTNTGNCADCHGDFDGSNYSSFTSDDAANWGMNLMNGHVSRYGLGCTDCHDSVASAPVSLNSSLSGISCTSCHGREQDITPNDGAFGGSTPGRGDGLRARHARAGVLVCSGCHTADSIPVGENIAPVTYVAKGIDPCNENAFGSVVFGKAGLDNDGDGFRDLLDPDCATSNTAPIANNDSGVTNQDSPVTLNVLANDTDADGDVLTINSYDTSSAFGGTVLCDLSGGNCTYTPALGFSGADSFSYDVTDGSAVSASRATVNITVEPLPNRAPSCSNITPATGQLGVLLNFNATVSDPDGDTLSYLWSFGDGATSTLSNPEHSFSLAGTYTASLTVDDGRGGSASCSASIVISDIPPLNQAPTCSNISPVNGVAGVALNFTASASDPNGDPLSYSWDFGDGGTSTDVAPVHSFVSAGSYSVNLSVDDGNGGSASCNAQVTVTQAPPANQTPQCSGITPTAGQAGVAISFSATASDPDGDPLGYTWDFGDGLTSTAMSPTHSFTTAGIYLVSLTVNDGKGESASCETDVAIAAAPPPATDGEALYNNRCVFCHGNPADPSGMGPLAFTVPGASSCSIRGAIYNPAPWGVETMASLLQGTITDAEIDLIANYLSSFNTGEQLYTSMCSRCHGPNGNGNGLAHEAVRGASMGEINGAIREESVMRYLSCLLDNPEQLGKIAEYLGGTSQGGDTDGENDAHPGRGEDEEHSASNYNTRPRFGYRNRRSGRDD